MRIISEITGQEYKTVEGCLAAEKLFEEEQARKKAEEKALQEKKDAAYKKAIAACDEYLNLCGIDVEFTDHGYRATIHSDDKADKIFEDILNMLWN